MGTRLAALILMASFYVSNTGSDAANGSSGSPWLTLAHAQTVVRALSGPQTVICQNAIATTSTFALTSSDNTDTYWLNLDAGTRVTSWSDQGGGIWRASFTSSVDFHAIWVNGHRCSQARRGGLSGGQTKTTNGYSTIADLNGVPNPSTVRFGYDGNYTKPWNRVASIGASTITMVQPAHEYITGFAGTSGIGFAYANSQLPIWIANIYADFQAATAGTFYHDIANNFLYYCPFSFEDMTTAEVIVPNGLETLLSATGCDDLVLGGTVSYSHLNPADPIALRAENIGYNATNTRTSSWLFYTMTSMPAAVQIATCNNLLLHQLDITHGSAMGLLVTGATTGDMYDCCIFDISGNGRAVSVPAELILSVCPSLDCHDNTIEAIGREFTGSSASLAYMAVTSNFEHEDIRFSPYRAYSFGLGGSTDRTWMDKCGEINCRYNDIYRVLDTVNCPGNDTIDGGGIHTNNKFKGTGKSFGLSLTDNVLNFSGYRNSGTAVPNASPSGGIYLDEDSCDVAVSNNVIRRVNDVAALLYNSLQADNACNIGTNYSDTTATKLSASNPQTSNTAPTVSDDPRNPGAAIVAAAGAGAQYRARHQAIVNPYRYFSPVAVSKTLFGSSLQNFPYLLSVTDARLKTVANGGHVNHPSGWDLAPYLMGSARPATPLSYQIRSYNASTGAVVLQMNLPVASATVDTLLVLAYGATSLVTDPQFVLDVFDGHRYLMLETEDNAASTVVVDSMGSLNGTAIRNTSLMHATGKVVDGFTLNGTSDYLSFAQTAGITGESFGLFTIFIWANKGSDDLKLMEHWAASSERFVFRELSGKLNFITFTTSQVGGDVTGGGTAGYRRYVARYSGAEMAVFNNGVKDATTFAQTGVIKSTGAAVPVIIGAEYDGTAPADEGVDEVAFDHVSRSDAWILSDFTNQNAPTTLYTLLDERTAGAAVTTFVFNEGAKQLTSGGTVDWAADTIKARLVLSSVIPDIDDTAITGYTAVGTDQTLASKTKTKNTTTDRIIYSAQNATYTTPGTGDEIGSAVIYKFVTDDSDAIPLFCLALTPVTTANTTLVLTFDTGGIGATVQ